MLHTLWLVSYCVHISGYANTVLPNFHSCLYWAIYINTGGHLIKSLMCSINLERIIVTFTFHLSFGSYGYKYPRTFTVITDPRIFVFSVALWISI